MRDTRERRVTFPPTIDYASHVYLQGVDVYLSVWRAIEDQMVWKKAGPLRNSRRSIARNDKGREKTKNEDRSSGSRVGGKFQDTNRLKKGGLKVGRAVRRLTKDAIPSKQICIVLCDVLPHNFDGFCATRETNS